MHSPLSNAVIAIAEGSPAGRAGLREGDRIISVNRRPVRDALDLAFHSHDPSLAIRFVRDRRTIDAMVTKDSQEDTGIELQPMKVATCSNNCVFCFVSQLPKGLRRSLYLKDEDYRYSFLHGNYVTLSNLSDEDRNRIVEQRLSPLYISVHATDPSLRRTLLGNRRAPDIMEELRFLASHKIKFHAQIVLCPGLNDGAELERTLRDLCRLHPYLLSVAVVPVGLTRHRRTPVRPVGPDDARRAVLVAEAFRRKNMKKHGDPLVYAADEMYLLAGLPFPPLKEYGDLPQIENGVGMVPLFLHRARFVKRSSFSPSKKRFLTLTGTSFFPFLDRFLKRLAEKTQATADVVAVPNHFFGESVTVAGLLTGRDIIRALSDRAAGADTILLPDIVLRDSSNVTLDDLSVDDIGAALGTDVVVIESSIPGLLKGLQGP